MNYEFSPEVADKIEEIGAAAENLIHSMFGKDRLHKKKARKMREKLEWWVREIFLRGIPIVGTAEIGDEVHVCLEKTTAMRSQFLIGFNPGEVPSLSSMAVNIWNMPMVGITKLSLEVPNEGPARIHMSLVPLVAKKTEGDS